MYEECQCALCIKHHTQTHRFHLPGAEGQDKTKVVVGNTLRYFLCARFVVHWRRTGEHIEIGSIFDDNTISVRRCVIVMHRGVLPWHGMASSVMGEEMESANAIGIDGIWL